MNFDRIRRPLQFAGILLSMLFGVSLARADFLVSDNFGNQVLRYSETDGSFLGSFIGNSNNGGLNGAVGMLFNTNGELLVASQNTNQVLRYDGTTGAFLGVFANTDLNAPAHLGLDPTTGNILVSNLNGNSITRFNSAGMSLGSLTSGGPALQGVSSFAFGPNGNLTVGSFNSGQILTYDSAGNFISQLATGYNGASGLWFQGNDLWVASLFLSQVSRLDATGTATLNFSTGPGPQGIGAFPSFILASPLGNDEVLVALTAQAGVYRFATDGSGTNRGLFMGGGGLQVPGEVLRIASIPEPVTLVPLMLLVGRALGRRRRKNLAIVEST